MKTIGNISSIAVYAAVATVLAACSANPVEDTNKKVSTVKKAPVKVAAASGKAVVKKVLANKAVGEKAVETAMVVPKPMVKKAVIRKPVVQKSVVRKPSKAEALAKKKAIIAMAQKQKYHDAYAKKVNGYHAAYAKKVLEQKNLARSSAKKTVAYRKPVSGVRSPQPVGVRSVQTVGTRSRQPVASRAKLAVVKKTVSAPIKKYVAKRVQPKQPVQNRPAVHLASRKVVPAQRKQTKTYQKAVYRAPAKPAYRKAVYRKPVVKRSTPKRTIQRIDPNNSFGYALSNAAIERTKHRVRYDGSYVKIGYPWGDVPKSIGVCTDVVIRSYRRMGIDLQSEVHKDISKDFYAYPNLTKWGLEKPDPNIDHRRVYNLQAFFKRHKAELPRSRNPRDYKPGDLVTWMVGPTFPHIGVVVNKPSPSDPRRLMIAHNVGAGPVIEDILFRFPMTGHYRYTPKHRKVNPALHFAKTPPPASVLRKQKQKQASYAQLLQASKYLNTAKPAVPKVDKQAKALAKKPARIYLAQLDSVLAAGTTSDLDSAAVQALLK